MRSIGLWPRPERSPLCSVSRSLTSTAQRTVHRVGSSDECPTRLHTQFDLTHIPPLPITASSRAHRTSLDNFITLGFNLTMPALHAALTRELLANYDALDAACGIAPAPPVASPSFDSPLALWVWGILIAVCAVACGAAGFATGCGIHAYSVRRRQRMRLGRAGNELEALEEAAAGASGTGLEHALLAGEEKGMP